jgi:hypothetical protein
MSLEFSLEEAQPLVRGRRKWRRDGVKFSCSSVLRLGFVENRIVDRCEQTRLVHGLGQVV